LDLNLGNPDIKISDRKKLYNIDYKFER